MSIIVTGCSGFVGTRFVDLVKDSVEVIGLDIEDAWEGYTNPHHFYKINVNSYPADLQKIVNNHHNIEAFIHIGAYSNTLGVDSSYIYALNYIMSMAYLAVANLLNIPFIWSSTAATYGHGEQGFNDDDNIGYLESLKPLNDYARSKNEFDIYVRKNPSDYKIKMIGLKYFNVYGPYEFHKGKMMSCGLKFYHEVKKLNKIYLFDKYLKAPVTRNFIYVDDIVQATMKVLKTNMPNGIYHLGSSQNNSFADIAEYIAKALNVKPEIGYIEPKQKLLSQYQYKTQSDIKRLKSYIDFNPLTLKEGIANYVTWLDDNIPLVDKYMNKYDIMELANP